MKRNVIGSMWLLALVLSVAEVRSAKAQVPENLGNPNIEIQYVEPIHSIYRPIFERLQKRRALEELRAFLAPLKIPDDDRIAIKTAECGTAYGEVRPALPAVICYEYLHELEQFAPKDKTPQGVSRADAIAGAFVMGALHEVAHAVFKVLKVPVWGREEDAADKLAALIMLQFGKDVAWRTLTGTASFFEASKQQWTGSDFADASSPQEQRYYNFLCMAYGSDPDTFKEFVRPTLLKTRRGEGSRCFGEVAQVRSAFRSTIGRHIDQKLLEEVRKFDWLKPDDGHIEK